MTTPDPWPGTGPPPPNQPPQWGQQPWGAVPPSSYYPPMYQPPRQTNTMAVAALVSSLFVPPLGIVFGHIALSQIKRNNEEGHGLAVAGLVIGYVFTGLYVVGFAIWVVMIAVVVNEIDKMPTTPPPHRTTFRTYSMPAPTFTAMPTSSPAAGSLQTWEPDEGLTSVVLRIGPE